MKGFVWKLQIFGLDVRGVVNNVKSILIPCEIIEDSAISDNGKTVVLFGDEGTKILKVDLASGDVSFLFKKTQGQPGFSPTTRIWYTDGDFFVKGYFYNSNGYFLNDAVSQLDLSTANDLKPFKSTWNLDETYRSIGKPVAEVLVSGNEGFLIGTDGKKQTLFHYLGGKLSPIDTEMNFGPVAAIHNRVLYTVPFNKQHLQAILNDLAAGKSWTLNPDAGVIFPYLSKTGKIAVLGMTDSKSKFSYYFVREDNGFKLEPISNLQGTTMQILRLSADGRRFAAQDNQGFSLGTIP